MPEGFELPDQSSFLVFPDPKERGVSFRFTATRKAAGVWSVAAFPPGKYRIKVEADGRFDSVFGSVTVREDEDSEIVLQLEPREP